jgi:hypothetical protein
MVTQQFSGLKFSDQQATKHPLTPRGSASNVNLSSPFVLDLFFLLDRMIGSWQDVATRNDDGRKPWREVSRSSCLRYFMSDFSIQIL